MSILFCQNICRDIIWPDSMLICEENFQIYPESLTTLLLFCDNSNLKRPLNVNFILPKALQNIQKIWLKPKKCDRSIALNSVKVLCGGLVWLKLWRSGHSQLVKRFGFKGFKTQIKEGTLGHIWNLPFILILFKRKGKLHGDPKRL